MKTKQSALKKRLSSFRTASFTLLEGAKNLRGWRVSCFNFWYKRNKKFNELSPLTFLRNLTLIVFSSSDSGAVIVRFWWLKLSDFKQHKKSLIFFLKSKLVFRTKLGFYAKSPKEPSLLWNAYQMTFCLQNVFSTLTLRFVWQKIRKRLVLGEWKNLIRVIFLKRVF